MLTWKVKTWICRIVGHSRYGYIKEKKLMCKRCDGVIDDFT
jgi:hypothetical protein